MKSNHTTKAKFLYLVSTLICLATLLSSIKTMPVELVGNKIWVWWGIMLWARWLGERVSRREMGRWGGLGQRWSLGQWWDGGLGLSALGEWWDGGLGLSARELGRAARTGHVGESGERESLGEMVKRITRTKEYIYIILMREIIKYTIWF